MWEKFKRKVKGIITNKIANTFLQFKIYPSYWHYYFNKNAKIKIDSKSTQYICLKPNYGAGIGHQLANWNTGLYFAGYFHLHFTHAPFSNIAWEAFLGLGEGEITLKELEKKKFKKVLLPKFDSNNEEHVALIGKIINSYNKKNIIFSLETDQGYVRQYETWKLLSKKFFKAEARKNDKLIFADNRFNIAVHIRRGDIVEMQNKKNPDKEDRWLDNNYYVNILKTVLSNLRSDKQIAVYLFSQGEKADFPEFEQFGNVNYCLEMGAIDSFLHMTYADLLISSRSSFSYTPALISKGVKICPKVFWHKYPPTDDYILADNNGDFDINKLWIALNY